jgi:hypothetical protein
MYIEDEEAAMSGHGSQGTGLHESGVSAGHPAMDYAEHERTFAGFVTATKWGVALMTLLLVFMAITLV